MSKDMNEFQLLINQKINTVDVEIINGKYIDKNDLTNNYFNNIDHFPGVYIIKKKNEKKIYVGESGHPYNRLIQHIAKSYLEKNDHFWVFHSKQFHKSFVYDLETRLLDYLFAEEKYNLINEKMNQGSHNYFLKNEFNQIISKVWSYLLEIGIAFSEMEQLENKTIYKLSPFKNLNEEQSDVVNDVKQLSCDVTLIEGLPGTGKSVIVSNLYKDLSKKYNVCLTSGTIPIVDSFKRNFKIYNKNLQTNSKVYKTSELINSNDYFDVVIIDEAHRLKSYTTKGDRNSQLHMKNNNYDDELSLIFKKTKKVILLYDSNQICTIYDFDIDKYIKPDWKKYNLKQQMRITNGDNYINWIFSKFDKGEVVNLDKTLYDFKIFNSFTSMLSQLKDKHKNYPLTRLTSGYTRKWVSQNNKDLFDFEIEHIKLRWNSKPRKKGIFSEGSASLEEVNYFHTVQGFDLDYCGVIVGKDLFIDEKGELQVNEKYVAGKTGKPLLDDPLFHNKLRKWVFNRYKILFSRGVKGTYVWFEDEKVRDYFMK